MKSRSFLSINTIIFLFAGAAFAQTSPGAATLGIKSGELSQSRSVKEKKEEEQVLIGVIASTAGRGQSGAVEVETGGASPGDEASAISGGVSNNGGECTASLTNNSKENAYRVRFDVIGMNEGGRRAMKKSFSGKIAAGSSMTRTFRCKPNHTMQLKLKSAVKG